MTLGPDIVRAVLPAQLRGLPGCDVIRLGPAGDGGYLVAEDVLGHVEWLVGLGLSDDWRFEAHLQSLTACRMSVYDDTVTPRFWARRAAGRLRRRLTRTLDLDVRRANEESGFLRYRRFFRHPHREHIAVRVGPGTGEISLAHILDRYPHRAAFVKMDIEGCEWQQLDALIERQDRIVGAAIEFHDVPDRMPELLAFVAAATSWSIVGVSVNNVTGVDESATPRVVEVSFARTDLLRHRPTQGSAITAPRRTNSALGPAIDLQFEDCTIDLTAAADAGTPHRRRPTPAAPQRMVLCIPRRCGLNDVLVQIWESYCYARAQRRQLLIDTRLSGFWDDLDHYLVPTAATAAGPVPIVTHLSDSDIALLNELPTYPASRQGRLDFLYRDTAVRTTRVHHDWRLLRTLQFPLDALRLPAPPPFRAGMTRRWEFLADAVIHQRSGHDDHCFSPRPETVVVHHRSGGGPQSIDALRLFTFTDPIRAAVRDALDRCGADFDALHIRNTDLQTDYRDVLLAVGRTSAGRRVLVCSDDATVIRDARSIMVDCDVITATETPDTGGKPLHKLGAHRDLATRRRVNTSMFVDLVCLAASRTLTITTTTHGITSGYSRLSQLLHSNPELVRQLLTASAVPGAAPSDRLRVDHGRDR